MAYPPGVAAPFMTAFERIRTASILAPLLVFDLICAAVALIATPLLGTTHPFLWVAWMPFFVCGAFTLLAYGYWSFKAPNRLQTEHYQLEQQRLFLIGDERDPNSMRSIKSLPSANTKVGAI